MVSNSKRKPFTFDLTKLAHRGKLNEALVDGDAATIEKWLEAGLDPNLKVGTNTTMLSRALNMWSWEHGTRLLDLLKARGADPNLGVPPPLFKFYYGLRLSWLLQAGADPRTTFGYPGRRAFRVEAWVKEDSLDKREDYWLPEFNTLKFWRMKMAVRPRPEVTRAFALFVADRALTASWDRRVEDLTDELASPDDEDGKLLKKGPLLAWLDRNFDSIDYFGGSDDDHAWVIVFRKSDGGWLDTRVSIELHLGESHDVTGQAFSAHLEAKKLAKMPMSRALTKKRKGL